MSELQSQMMAEEELSRIFSKSKHQSRTGIIRYNPGLMMLSPSSNSQASIADKKEDQDKGETGFSNFGHFKPPIKRPSCNPIVKDERFKRLNEINHSSNFEKQFDRLPYCDK